MVEDYSKVVAKAVSTFQKPVLVQQNCPYTKNNLVTTLYDCNKVVTRLLQPCYKVVILFTTLLQGCSPIYKVVLL